MEFTRTRLSLLVVFDAIARTGSVTQAAQRMSLSQPALSHALAQLRGLFDDPLFVRGNGGLVMTPRARSLVDPVRRILDSALSLLQPAAFDPAMSDKELRIGFSECSMVMLGMPALARLRAEAPGMRIAAEIVDQVSDDRVQDGTLDMGLWYSDHEATSLRSEALLVDRYVGVVDARHPLAAQCRAGKPVTAKQYTRYPHVHTLLRGLGTDAVSVGVSKAGLSRSVASVGHSFMASFPLLIGSQAITAVPSMLAKAARLMSFDLATFELPFAIRPISYGLHWSERTDGDPASAWVRQVFRDTAARYRDRLAPLDDAHADRARVAGLVDHRDAGESRPVGNPARAVDRPAVDQPAQLALAAARGERHRLARRQLDAGIGWRVGDAQAAGLAGRAERAQAHRQVAPRGDA